MPSRNPIAWRVEGSCFRCTSHKLSEDGYPRITRNGRIRPIARYILIRRLGDISSDIVSRHTCDNKWCIRPDHIISGTSQENTSDWKERGTNKREQRGEKNLLSKLTSEQIYQIREASGLQKEIAKRFGIGKSQVSRIKRRETWTHL